VNIAYLDCFSGASGNMLLGALIHAGLDEKVLHQTLATLGLDEVRPVIQQVSKQGMAACHVHFDFPRQRSHRHLSDIKTLIRRSTLCKSIQNRAIGVFERLARAEARVHGTTVDKVHFHEVGAIDAIADIICVLNGLEVMGVEEVHSSPLPVSNGSTICEHGTIPLPAPAVCEILKGAPVHGLDLDMELVTPTGAALVMELTNGINYGPMPAMVLEGTGYGTGSRERPDGLPNLLRICLGSRDRIADEATEVTVLETHLDDFNSETWPHVSEQLMAAGALDVSLTPMLMKKGRPGYQLRVLCNPARALALKELILTETSAIGLRFHRQQRMTLPRRTLTINTELGLIRAKEVQAPDGPRLSPEYEDCRSLSLKLHIPIQRVYTAFAQAAGKRNSFSSGAGEK